MVRFSNRKCLPTPSKPNSTANDAIKFYIIILILLTSLQAYIKRSRAVLAGSVYPERDQERAVWLYNHLLSVYKNMGLLSDDTKRRKQSSSTSILGQVQKLLVFVVSFAYSLIMHLSCYYCFGSIDRVGLKQLFRKYKCKLSDIWSKINCRDRQLRCVKCSSVLDAQGGEFDLEPDEVIKCERAQCPAIYCVDCYNELDNVCKLCKMNIVRDDCSSNESFEVDSSDEEQDVFSTLTFKQKLVLPKSSQRSFIDSFGNDLPSRHRSDSNRCSFYIDESEIEGAYQDSDDDGENSTLKSSVEKLSPSGKCVNRLSRTLSKLSSLGDDKVNCLLEMKNKYPSHWNEQTTTVDYEKQRARQVIDNSFKILYHNLRSYFHLDYYIFVIDNSSILRKIFNQKYCLVDECATFVVKNFVLNLKINEYFDEQDLTDDYLNKIC